MYNLGTKENEELKRLIEYFEDNKKTYKTELNSMYNSRVARTLSETIYKTKSKLISKKSEKNDNALNLLKRIANFSSTSFYVDPELLGILNDIFPLLDENNKNRISAVIYTSLLEHEKEEAIFAAEVSSSKTAMSRILNPQQQEAYNDVVKGFERLYSTRNYQAKIFVNNTDTPDEWYMPEPFAQNYEMINTLMSVGALTDPYIIENYDLIRESYITNSKIVFINNKIEEILLMTESKCDINLGRLKKALRTIRDKNKKLKETTQKVINKVNEKRLREEYENYINVEGKKIV